jgi:crotonobetainyl-CoA:carnitine CoA-transferase CaiB-like acyl-CoA transferase
MARRALEGLRVLDLSRVLAGPFCTMMLADHGADVIKVEPPGGDETRHYGPPFLEGESVYFMGLNRNKRGIVLDLARPEGQAVVRRLVQTSDVLVENFKNGTMERWGLRYEELRQLNPRLIYCGISGFGRTGPYAAVSGYDGALQAMGGLMSVTGEAGGEPLKAGIAVADLTTGLFANQAVLLALQNRYVTGFGQKVEVSLLESVVALLHPHNSNYLNTGVVGKPHGNSHPMICPYDAVPTKDRPIYLPSGNDGQMKRLAQAIGQPNLAEDPRFRTNPDRVANRPALMAILAEAFRTRTASEWCQILWEAGVPAGPVNNVAEVFADPQVQHREMIQTVEHPLLGRVRLPGLPVKLSETPGAVLSHPPLMGQHTADVLAELGYSAGQIADLLDRGVALQWGRDSEPVAGD